MSTTRSRELPKHYRCPCGKKHPFALWVYAHWDIEITHKCSCGRTNTIRRGRRVKD